MVIGLIAVALCVVSVLILLVSVSSSAPPRTAHRVRTVGIVGNGILGGTHRRFAEMARLQVRVFDARSDRSSVARIEDLVESDLILVCVNTPPDAERGACDSSQVESVCRQLDAAAATAGVQPAVVIKSTVIMGTTRRLAAACPHIHLAFSPERLRERCPEADFRDETFIVLAGDERALERVEDFYRQMLPNVVFHRTELELAEFFKYSVNSLIAVVVSYANGLYDGCQAIGLDYTELVRLLRLDPRLAGCPLDVPGPDGRRGWGGSCLPKDTSALSKWAEEQQDLARTLAIMLAATWSVNRIIRPDDGWDCITTAQKQRKTPAAPPP